ncbi:hypothetical protein BC829DRAFT_441521 [Chytridium lagenaria]|nr:hypothetical protein BC829DRAFT_441521 [Chytridium lagenaria]
MPPEPATSKLKGSNFTASETLQLLKAVRAKLPKGQNNWLNVETYTGVFSKNITKEAVTEAVAIQSLIDNAVCVAKGGGPVGLSNEEEERFLPFSRTGVAVLSSQRLTMTYPLVITATESVIYTWHRLFTPGPPYVLIFEWGDGVDVFKSSEPTAEHESCRSGPAHAALPLTGN